MRDLAVPVMDQLARSSGGDVRSGERVVGVLVDIVPDWIVVPGERLRGFGQVEDVADGRIRCAAKSTGHGFSRDRRIVRGQVWHRRPDC